MSIARILLATAALGAIAAPAHAGHFHWGGSSSSTSSGGSSSSSSSSSTSSSSSGSSGGSTSTGSSGGSTPVPEPSEFGLFALGVAGLVIGRRGVKRRQG